MYDSWAFGNYVWGVRIFFCKWTGILQDICLFYHKTPCAASEFSGSCMAIAGGKPAGKKSRFPEKNLIDKEAGVCYDIQADNLLLRNENEQAAHKRV